MFRFSTERVSVRFAASLVANVIRAALSFATGLLVARSLGAANYGDLNFLLGSFSAIAQFIDMGTSTAFYTFLSQRRRSRGFIAIYGVWLVLQFAAGILILLIVLPAGALELIWVGQQRGIVLLAFVANFAVNQLWGFVAQIGESVRKTVLVEISFTVVGLAHLVLILLLNSFSLIRVSTVLWLMMVEYVAAVFIIGHRVLKPFSGTPEPQDSYRRVFKEFASYCKPLILYSWFGFLYSFADRWLLQQFGGSVQQGFFAIGQQFANISLIAATAILKVFWKEVAEALNQQNQARAQELYRSITRCLYCVSAWLSCLLIPYSGEILEKTVGANYDGARFCLALMFIYPIHQSLGQVQGTFSFASGATKSYARIGILTMLAGIPMTYFTLAPGTAALPGLGLAATGLALKMVIVNIVSVSLLGYIIARDNGWKVEYRYQVVVFSMLFTLGWTSKLISRQVLTALGAMQSSIDGVLCGSILFGILSITLFVAFPRMAGLTDGVMVSSWIQKYRKRLA